MKYKFPGAALISCFLLGAVSLCWCIYRDIQIEKAYPGDLRNRIVGARLQMDGLSPYFYHWKAADGLRYYDWGNRSSLLKISNITASPFFHQLLYPISNLPQRTISKIWLGFEYLAWVIMTALALKFAKENRQKGAVLIVALLFLYSYAWLTNIALGQMYICIPLLSFLFYYFVTRQPTWWTAILSGVCALSLLLIRPNTALFLLPFLFLADRYSWKFKIILFISASALLLFAFGNAQSRLYWSDYKEALNEHVKMHQGLSPAIKRSLPLPKFDKVEGWEQDKITKAEQLGYYKHNGENGNVFVFLNIGLHVKTPLWVLSLLFVIFISLICLMYFKQHGRTPQVNAFSISLLGSLLYMASDIFSPIHRAHYNANPWMFPLLLTASAYSISFKKLYVLGILTGLLLNSVTFSIFPMEHTIGEYIIYGSLLGLLLTYKSVPGR